ncbi:AMP-binding protein [Bradyrhizobium iriomotense]|uniref:AMP-binding protein n=1 Tax=Bradyrhizobium iriomotense TaxID=441950 RepID=UPI001B8A1C7E|nr:AMP-binding protein [Bradyrhizobium iriomotense]MBR0784752.1 AMP-binding protein [Bradyrhizobium iriomotense]
MASSAPECLNPFEGLNLGWLLATQAKERGSHPFIVYEPFDRPAITLSYREFYAAANRLAAGLRRRGVRPGDRIVIHLDNCPEFLLSWSACGLAGAVAVTTNTRSSEEELGYYAAHSEPVAAITQPAYAKLVKNACPRLGWVAVTDNDCGQPFDAGDRPEAEEEFNRLLIDAEEGRPGEVGPLDPLAIQYTSGTTARPKAVLWTHANALWAARVSATHEALLSTDTHHWVLPLFHTNALSYSWLACLWAGATLVLQPRFSSSRFWAVALSNRCTWSSITAFCYRALLNGDIPRSHFFRNWGIAFSDPVVVEKFRIRPMSWWGMTETLTQGIVGYPHMPVPYGAIGRPAPEYRIRVLDPQGKPVVPGGSGALHVGGIRGVSLFREYYRNADATRDAFDEHGFFRTGDQVTLLDNGYVRFADRIKDMLKIGGENVASLEIERAISTVEGVEEAAVVAWPHPMLDEVAIAFIRVGGVLKDKSHTEVAELVRAECRRLLADFKIPREVHVLEDFPRANIGKTAKAELRKWRQLHDTTSVSQTNR